MLIILNSFTNRDIINNPWITFIYDSCKKEEGLFGLSKFCYNAKNTIGIPIRENINQQYTDTNYEENINYINEAILQIENILKTGKIVIIPKSSFGGNNSKLKKVAPKTHIFLNNKLHYLANEYASSWKNENITMTTLDSYLQKKVSKKLSGKLYIEAVNFLKQRLKDKKKELTKGQCANLVCRLYARMIDEQFMN